MYTRETSKMTPCFVREGAYPHPVPSPSLQPMATLSTPLLKSLAMGLGWHEELCTSSEKKHSTFLSQIKNSYVGMAVEQSLCVA